MSPPTRPKHGPAREDLMQIESKHCRHPHWHLATRAEFEAKAKLENKDSADRPHAYGLVDTRGDAFGKYRASPAFGFGSTGRGERAGDQSPGPTGYTPKDDRLRRRSPSAGFGASRRSGLEWEGSDSPGPGYDCRGGLGGPAARLLGRGAPAARPSLPGPGAYATASGSAPGAPRFGPPPGRPRGLARAASAGDAGSFGYLPKAFGSDARGFRVGARPQEKVSTDDRRIGGNRTQFGHHGK